MDVSPAKELRMKCLQGNLTGGGKIIVRIDEEKRRQELLSSVSARGLAMMTGVSDCCFKKPQGSNEMKMTTAVETAGIVQPLGHGKADQWLQDPT